MRLKEYIEILCHIFARKTAKKGLCVWEESPEEFQTLIEPDYLEIILWGIAVYRAIFKVYNPDTKTYEVDNFCYYYFDLKTGKLITIDSDTTLKESLTKYAEEKGLSELYPNFYEITPCAYIEDNGRFLFEVINPAREREIYNDRFEFEV